MKRTIIYLCFLLYASALISMEQNSVNNAPQVNSAHVHAATQAIHNHAIEQRGLLNSCAENIIVGLSVQVLTFLALDLYQGSKGYTYQLIFGPKPEEILIKKQIDNLHLQNEGLDVEIVNRHAENLGKYQEIMNKRIDRSKEEDTKKRLAERLAKSEDAFIKRHELAQGIRSR